MAFSVVENPVRTVWCNLDSSSTYYMGQLVAIATGGVIPGGAISPLAVPSGISDVTTENVPYGVIVGFNERTPRYATLGSMKPQSLAGVITQADQLTYEKVGNEGMYSKADPQPLAQVAVIDSSSVLRGPIFKGAYGTVLTTCADTGGADTTGYTTAGTQGSGCNFTTPVAQLCTAYCRTGNNAGIYRVTNDTSATAIDATIAFPYDVALGDTFVRVPFKQGLCYMYIGGPGMYVDGSANPATNYFIVHVIKMDLSTSGREYVEFSFNPTHFIFPYRASS